MSINRIAKRVDANQKQVVDALRARGYKVVIISQPVDLLVGTPKGWILLEVKDGNKPASAQKPTKAQEKFFMECAGKYPLFVVNSAEFAVELVGEFCK